MEKAIKVIPNARHASFDVLVGNDLEPQDGSSQCAEKPKEADSEGRMELKNTETKKSITARPGDRVKVIGNLLDCSFTVPSHDNDQTVVVPDDDSTEVVLDLR